MVCVIGIANGPVDMVTLYEEDVQQRAVELGLTTKEKIKNATILSGIALFVPALILMPYIPKKVLIRKWVGTVVGFPVVAALIAGLMTLI